METITQAARHNWARNVTFQAPQVLRPTSLGELRTVVAGARRVRALGTAHSFNDMADSPDTVVSVTGLPAVAEVDTERAQLRVSAGTSYGQLGPYLESFGLALPNLASLPHISVGGACATGSHGSGDGNGGLATSVAELLVVTADGSLLTLRRGEEDFEGAVVGLGALGVVVSLTLDLVASFGVRTTVYQGLDLDVLDQHFEELVGAAYSVCLFTDWRRPRLTQIWVMERIGDPDPGLRERDWFTATAATRQLHPVSAISPAGVTQQLGVPGPWYERLTHFRSDSTPSSGDELQSEYLLPREQAVAALHALAGVRQRIQPVLQVCEVRTIAGDGLWLSPSQGGDQVSIHFTWDPDAEAVLPVVALVEELLEPYGCRPHWGKVFTIPAPRVRSRYERMPDFRRLMQRMDPGGKFQNAWTELYLGD